MGLLGQPPRVRNILKTSKGRGPWSGIFFKKGHFLGAICIGNKFKKGLPMNFGGIGLQNRDYEWIA